MHLTAEDIIVELVDQEGNAVPHGTAGEVVVTHLATSEFPFIRYRTGDVAIQSEKVCACGRGLPVLQEIQGRTTDFIIATDGTIMHGLAVVYPIRDIPGIASFKVVQETLERVVVQIVPGIDCGPEVEAIISKGIKARLGQSVEVCVLRVEDIPREKSGKFRYVQSLVMPT
ncbi:hypothetical protein [Propionivibrio sp.]|nr:hypothetical protein [Propionivibrio sp.]